MIPESQAYSNMHRKIRQPVIDNQMGSTLYIVQTVRKQVKYIYVQKIMQPDQVASQAARHADSLAARYTDKLAARYTDIQADRYTDSLAASQSGSKICIQACS